MYKQFGQRGICDNCRHRKRNLCHKLAVITDAFCPLQNTVAHKKPRDKAYQHKREPVKRNDSTAKFHIDQTCAAQPYRKCKPIYKKRKQRFNNRPRRANCSALVGFDQLIFGQQKNLPAKMPVLAYYR